jgi:hypothetical protein
MFSPARRAIRCLALELPASVHRDVADIFRPLLEQLEVHSAEVAELRTKVERVREAHSAEPRAHWSTLDLKDNSLTPIACATCDALNSPQKAAD